MALYEMRTYTLYVGKMAAPTQVGGGIDRARGGLAKGIGRTARQDAEEQAAQRDRVDRQRRLAGRPPCSL